MAEHYHCSFCDGIIAGAGVAEPAVVRIFEHHLTNCPRRPSYLAELRAWASHHLDDQGASDGD